MAATNAELQDLLTRWMIYGKAMAAAGSTLPRHLLAETQSALMPEPELSPSKPPACICHRCIKEEGLTDQWGHPLNYSQMILCPVCGNKRCPHASDHRLACTHSNEPGQPGSVY